MFNWGLHDGPQLFDFPPANVTIPGQEGNSSVYPEQLESIVVRLKALAPDSQLLFAITSPMICKADQDAALQYMNSQAAAIMAKHGIETVDLHAAIVGKCGPAPQAECFGEKECFCPHCINAGYQWLANSTIAPAISKLL